MAEKGSEKQVGGDLVTRKKKRGEGACLEMTTFIRNC